MKKTPTFEKDDVVDVTRGAVTYRQVWIREVAEDGALVGTYRMKARGGNPAYTNRVRFKATEVTAWYEKIFARHGG
jgi:hypothetical protein